MVHKRIDVGEQSEKRWTIFSCCRYCGSEIVGGEAYFKEYRYGMPFKIGKENLVCPVCKKSIGLDLDFTDKAEGCYRFDYKIEVDEDDGEEYDWYCAVRANGKAENAIKIGSVEKGDINDKQVQLNFNFIRQDRAYCAMCRDDAVVAFKKNVEEAEQQSIEHSTVNTNEIKNNPELLKQFLEHLISVETSIYSSRMRLINLCKYKYQIAQELEIQNNTAGMAEKQLVAEAEENLRNRPRESAFSASRPKEPIPPYKPILEQPGLFNKKKVQEANEIALAKYEKRKEQYEIDIENFKKALSCFEAEVAEKVASEKAKAEQALEDAQLALERAMNSPSNNNGSELETIIKSEIDNTIELLKSQIKCKNELYSTGVVYGKYRDLVALSSFYEYLLAGRCTSLEGPNGAYNIYEGEIRSDLIISKLSDVVESLENIKKNQYMVYTQLQSAASDLAGINGKMDSVITAIDYLPSIAKSAEMIAYNTAQAAFYVKKNKELTDAIGFMVALK